METTLESILFYCTFSVINTIFVPCTTLLYDSTAATRTSKLSRTIEHFLWNPPDFSSDDVLSCLWIVFTNSVFQVPPQKIVRWVEILGIGWPRVVSLTQNESVPWKVMPEVFKCSVWESVLVAPHFSNRTLAYLRYNFHGTDSLHIKLATNVHPIPKISTHQTIFWGGTWKTEFVKTIFRQEREASEEKSDDFHKKCSIELWTILMFELLLCCYTAARCMEQT